VPNAGDGERPMSDARRTVAGSYSCISPYAAAGGRNEALVAAQDRDLLGCAASQMRAVSSLDAVT
jgi:hypothetical protein